MFIHKNWTSYRIAQNLREKEIEKLVHKFFVFMPYRQNLRYSMKNGRGFKNPSPQEKKKAMRYLKQQEHYYRVMRHKNHIVKLKDLNTRDSCISRMGFRCNVTGKTWVHNRWIKISTVPLRHLLKHELLPGWQRASW